MAEVAARRQRAAKRIAPAIMWVWSFACAALFAHLAIAQSTSVDPVDQAVNHAKKWLYDQEHNGNWESPNADRTIAFGGRTALVTYALLASGESPAKEPIKSAVDFLASAELDHSDAVGWRCQVWAALPPEPNLRLAAGRDAFVLEHALVGGTQSADSAGIAGLWACGRSGIEIPRLLWRRAEGNLKSGGNVNPSASHIAALMMTREFLHAGEGLECVGNWRDPQLDGSLNWLADHAGELVTSEYDNLWALARIGAASGRRCFGKVDWYQRGSAELLKRQSPDGSWGSLPNTALALLFLAQGRAPVAIAKLEYGITPLDAPPKDGNWNQRPLDVANITGWISRQIGRPLNWQIVSIDDADLGDAPVLFIDGNQNLRFTDEQLDHLRRYALGGGLIVGHSDASSSMFTNSFKTLGKQLFPDYDFHTMSNDDPLLTQGPFPAKAWRHQPEIESLGNGCRTMMVLLGHGDPGRKWQTLWVDQATEGYMADRSREAAEFAADIVFYAANPAHLPNRRSAAAAVAAKAVYHLSVARLRYEGNWNPEPLGWDRLADWMRLRQGVALSVETVELGEGKLPGYRVAHLTGTSAFTLSEGARDEIRKFLDEGGTLIVEAAGGSKEFTASAQAELADILDDKTAVTLTPAHRVFACADDIDSVNYRPGARLLQGEDRHPHLRGIDLAGRTAVFISDDDLSAGLTGAGCDSIVGFDPPSARLLMSNMLLSTAAMTQSR